MLNATIVGNNRILIKPKAESLNVSPRAMHSSKYQNDINNSEFFG